MLAQSDEPDLLVTGQRVYMAGIGVQLLFVLVFAIYTYQFIQRLRREQSISTLGWASTKVRCIVWSMIVTVALIIVRPDLPCQILMGRADEATNRSESSSDSSSSAEEHLLRTRFSLMRPTS